MGYDRSILETYRPNETFYLPVAVRSHLHAIAPVQGADQPAGTYARRIFDRLLIDLSWNSSRLEGNTYSLLDTQRLVQAGLAAEGKSARETQMILNHKRAIELLVDAASEIGFNRYTILNLHGLLADNLLPDSAAAGRLRSVAVGIEGSVFHPLEGPTIIEECFDQLLATASAIVDPFEQAFFAMVQIPYLQPFEDANKRVSRLAANIPFVRNNIPPISFVDVPERDYTEGILGIYELRQVDLLRDVFIWAYERSCTRYSAIRQSLGEPEPFRLRHRELISSIIQEVIRGRMNKAAAVAHIGTAVHSLSPEDDRRRLAEVIQAELANLHEGNFARYRIRPSEFEEWRSRWR